MAGSPVTNAPLRNQARVLTPTAVAGTSPGAPATAAPATYVRPSTTTATVFIAPPKRAEWAPSLGRLVWYDDFWEEYARQLHGVGAVVTVSNEGQVVDALDGRNVDTLVLAVVGHHDLLQFTDGDCFLDDLTLEIHRAKRSGRPIGDVRRLVLLRHDCSGMNLIFLWNLGLELNATVVHTQNLPRHVGLADIALTGTREDIDTALGSLRSFALPASVARAVAMMHAGATRATVVWEGFAPVDVNAIPPPDPPDPATHWRGSKALYDRISRPAASAKYPITLDHELHIVAVTVP